MKKLKLGGKVCHRLWHEADKCGQWTVDYRDTMMVLASYIPKLYQDACNTSGYCPVCGTYLGFDRAGNPVELGQLRWDEAEKLRARIAELEAVNTKEEHNG